MTSSIKRFSLVLAVAVVVAAALFPVDPPPNHTGGFGEPTCLVCHFDNDLNDGSARFEIRGLDSVIGGRTYDLELILVRDDMPRAGFQLSARQPHGNDAGVLEPIDGRTATSFGRGVSFLQHTADGTAADGDSAAWSFRWTAPEDPTGVIFHAAGNAANGDESQFGDFIYTLEKHVPSLD